MNSRWTVGVAALVGVVGAVLSSAAGAQQVTALIGATIIDGNGGAPIRNGVVLIDGQTIRAVGLESRVTIPQGATRVDVTGKYIVPGLMDANVHLFPWPSWTYIEFLARYENNFEGIIEEGAQLALKQGVTTVFDSMGPARSLMNVRDRINRGEVEGSRLFVAGNIVGFRAVFTSAETMKSATPAFQARINARFELNGGPDLAWKTPAQVYDEMTRYIAAGFDFVKYGASGDGMPVNSEIGQMAVLRFSPEQQRAIVRAAHDAGVIVQTHATSAEALRVVVEVGNDMAQHCALTGPSRIPEETIKLMLKNKFYCGTQWGPLSEEQQQQLRDKTFPGSDQGNGTDIDYGLENELRLIAAGVPQLVSTDAGTIDPDVAKDPAGAWGGLGGFSAQIGQAHLTNMQAMRQRGMAPMAIIQAATRNIAAAYRKLERLGTLEPGKLADLVVVDADPLADIGNLGKVSLVMKEGRTVDRATLPRNPILTSEQAMNPGEVRSK